MRPVRLESALLSHIFLAHAEPACGASAPLRPSVPSQREIRPVISVALRRTGRIAWPPEICEPRPGIPACAVQSAPCQRTPAVLELPLRPEIPPAGTSEG